MKKSVLSLAFASVLFASQAFALDVAEYLDAVEYGNDEKLQEIFAGPDREAAINYHDSHGHTPLDYAIMRSNPILSYDALLLLVRTGMQPGSENVSPGMRLARQIVCGELPETVCAEDLNERLPSGMTPFLWACAIADPSTVGRFLQAGADASVNVRTWNEEDMPEDNALHITAAHTHYPQILTLLLKCGLDIESVSSSYMTPLLTACLFNELPDAAITLIRAGADVNARSGVSGTPFIYAARHAYALPLLKELAAHGAEIGASDDGGKTAMHSAAMNNPNPDVIRYLLSLGLPVNYDIDPDYEGGAPIMLAARHNPSPEVIKLLIEAGADLAQKDNDGNTAFQGLSKERIAWLKDAGLGAYVQ